MKHRAFFFDEKGEYIGKTWFNPKKETFEFRKGSYIYDKSNLSYYTSNRFWFWKKRTHYYRLGNPKSINFNLLEKSVFPAEQFNVIMKTEIAKKLNDLAKGSLLDWLNWKVGIGILIFLVIIGYLLKGGKIV